MNKKESHIVVNEEKAKEIAIEIQEIIGTSPFSFDIIVDKIMKIVKWKDEQFISMLPEIFDYFDNAVGLYDGGIDHSDKDKPEFIRHFSNKIFNIK